VVIAFIVDDRERFGVEPIWRVLREHDCKIAPSTFYAAATKAPSVSLARSMGPP
jgi:putative transposase